MSEIKGASCLQTHLIFQNVKYINESFFNAEIQKVRNPRIRNRVKLCKY